jgi:hypothetical protein
MLRLIALIIAGSVISGCDTCNPDGEPIVELSNYSTLQYSLVYGVGRQHKPIKPVSEQQWSLPLSLTSDKSSFVLVSSGGDKDTLTISYQREAKFQSNKCGIRVFLNDMKVDEPTTLLNIDVDAGSPFFVFNQTKTYRASIH